jgi:hypothetical protein
MNYQMWSKRMAAFLRGKGQILWDVTVDNDYVQPMNFLAPGSRDMFDANNKAVDYLFCALCQPEFDRVHTEHLACRIWSVLKEAHVGNAKVQARMYATYRREYENFTHLHGESIDALFQRFTVVVNNMRANVDVLPGKCSLRKKVRRLVRRNRLRSRVERNQVNSPNLSLNPSL